MVRMSFAWFAVLVASAGATPAYPVLRVVDGAPVLLRMDGPAVRVRLIGVETPETVYVTRTGMKYHRVGCRCLAKSSIPMPQDQAALRYGPCALCDPPTVRGPRNAPPQEARP